MRSKKSKQIVTGILAVILIVTMLIGVVSPVFAAEDEKGGAEEIGRASCRERVWSRV